LRFCECVNEGKIGCLRKTEGNFQILTQKQLLDKSITQSYCMTAARFALADIEAWYREEWELPGRVRGVAAARALKKRGEF
jgi:hypothetical protein